MITKILVLGALVSAFGIVGRYDYQDAVERDRWKPVVYIKAEKQKIYFHE